MLRSLVPQEPELLPLCRAKNWDEMFSRSKSHPNEAQPSEASLRGQGSTALALAVGCGAPMNVIEALVQANVHQIGVTNRNRGSILHDALKHKVSDEVLEFLLQETISYQSTYINKLPIQVEESKLSMSLGAVQFQHIRIQDNRFLSRPTNLLGVADDMGRTALHYLMERAKRILGSHSNIDATKRCIRSLIYKHVGSCSKEDSDGNTPLALILQAPRGPESEIFGIVELILSACPESATLTRKTPQPWRFQTLANRLSSDCGRHLSVGSPTPLYYALLNGRSLETVQILLDSNRRFGQKGSSVIVTQYHETLLHVAVTTRAPLSVLSSLALDYPEAVLIQDTYGLTPLDWLWIRHIVDWHAIPLDFEPSRIISRRRFVTNSLRESYEIASSNIPIGEQSTLSVNVTSIRCLQQDLLKKLKFLLPVTAAIQSKEPPIIKQEEGDVHNKENHKPWSLLHASCYVPCPIAMIRAALLMDPDSSHIALQTRDTRSGRYPLHYAAGRVRYSANVPVGVSRRIQVICERPPVLEILSHCPQACRSVDNQLQLPIHIAIDTAKKHRTELMHEFHNDEVSHDEHEVMEQLLACYPGALYRRDGKTFLFPWQQAAVGSYASINTIFSLLRANPSTISSQVKGELGH